MTLVTIHQAEHPETLPVMITEPELVLESELPTRLEELNNKTIGITETSITNSGNISGSNITTMNTQLTGITETTITKSGNISGSNISILETKTRHQQSTIEETSFSNILTVKGQVISDVGAQIRLHNYIKHDDPGHACEVMMCCGELDYINTRYIKIRSTTTGINGRSPQFDIFMREEDTVSEINPWYS